MSSNEDKNRPSHEGLGGNAPILSSFSIVGLHGDKTVSFKTDDAAIILMARNGSGKTTLLSAINSVLSERFHRLAELSFDRIEFNFYDRPLQTLTKSDVDSFSNRESMGDLASMAQDRGISLDQVLDIAQSVARVTDQAELRRHPGLNDLYRSSPAHSYRLMQSTISQYIEMRYAKTPLLKEAAEEVSGVLEGYDIVYLPTYRRIEMPWSKLSASSKFGSPRSGARFRNRFSKPEELNFGLEDIADKLEEIARQIESLSNAMYQRISANIINDLLDGSYSEGIDESEKPDREDLELFFERVKSSRYRSVSEVTPPDLDKIYSEEIGAAAKPFLLYFLSSLNEAIKTTQPLEEKVNGFVEVCNKYLSDEDYSAYAEGSIGPIGSDRKRLHLSRNKFRPQLKTSSSDKSIRIDALSSGEKQVVSLFARMYLYEKPKIVLFDEPELSLSIGWQTQLLPDLCAAPNFHQLIAITHSPFVFENSLDEFAANLSVAQYSRGDPELDFDLDDFEDLFDDLDLDSEGDD